MWQENANCYCDVSPSQFQPLDSKRYGNAYKDARALYEKFLRLNGLKQSVEASPESKEKTTANPTFIRADKKESSSQGRKSSMIDVKAFAPLAEYHPTRKCFMCSNLYARVTVPAYFT